MTTINDRYATVGGPQVFYRDFDYTDGAPAALVAELPSQIGVTRAMYVRGCRASMRSRPVPTDPDAVTAIITQNGNGYEVGSAEEFCKPVRDYRRQQASATAAGLRQVLTREAIRSLHVPGVPVRRLVGPDSRYHDFTLQHRPAAQSGRALNRHQHLRPRSCWPDITRPRMNEGGWREQAAALLRTHFQPKGALQ